MSAARRQNIKRGWGDDLAPISVSKIDSELFGALREIEGDQLIMRDNQIQVGAFTLTSNGLEMSGEAGQEEWGKLGDLLFRLEGSIQWLIGDWLAYGDNLAYGDLKARVEATGRDYNTVRNYMVVCRAFELSRRRYNLSFGHYQSAAALDPENQDRALAYAVENKQSVAAFRKMVHDHLKPPPTSVSSALPTEETSTPKPAFSGLEKLAQRDRSTWKPQDKAAILQYAAQVQTWLDNLVAEAKS
jgi:hypothetical protein